MEYEVGWIKLSPLYFTQWYDQIRSVIYFNKHQMNLLTDCAIFQKILPGHTVINTRVQSNPALHDETRT